MEEQMKVLRGDMSTFTSVPPGLEDARNRVLKLVEEIQKRTGLKTSDIVLAGFSQGKYLTLLFDFH
jgi:predicted esterase